MSGWSSAGAGAAATLPMTAVLLAAQRIAMPRPLPSVLLVRRLLPGLPPPADLAAGGVVHLAIGAVSGVTYDRVLGRPAGFAVPFGLLVWAAGYLLLMPVTRTLPPARDDLPARQVPLVAAHVVFGAALGLLLPCRPAAVRRTAVDVVG